MVDIMKNTFLMFAVLCLTGCATLGYQEPMAGPRARVRFVTTSNEVTVLRAYDDANCTQNESEWMRLRVGVFLNSSPKTLGMPLWNYHKNSAKEVFVEANKQITAMFFSSETKVTGMMTTYQFCATPFSYSFSENNDYEVKFLWNPRQCQVTISEFVRNGESWSLSEVARFDNKVNESNRGCLEQFKKLRLY